MVLCVRLNESRGRCRARRYGGFNYSSHCTGQIHRQTLDMSHKYVDSVALLDVLAPVVIHLVVR